MRTLLISALSFALTAYVIGHAYYLKQQFYPTVVYITKSHPCMAVMYLQAFIFVMLIWNTYKMAFFGELRPVEVEHLIEKSWYALTETCLAFTVFRDDLSPRFVAQFTLLFFLKCFHWLIEERIDLPLVTDNVKIKVYSLLPERKQDEIPQRTEGSMMRGMCGEQLEDRRANDLLLIGFSWREVLPFLCFFTCVLLYSYGLVCICSAVLLIYLAINDVCFIMYAYHATLVNGPSVQLVFGFEYSILLTVVAMVAIKYILNVIDLNSQSLWERKAAYLLHSEVLLGFVRVLLYCLFMAIMVKLQILPLFAIRPMFLVFRSFKKAFHDVILSRQAIRNMDMYPDATSEDLTNGDNVCIICREEMTVMCKKLPCNHIFHVSCLRSWFQRQQTCPTCRLDVLRAPRSAPSADANRPGDSIQANASGQHQQPRPIPPGGQGFGVYPFAWPPPPYLPFPNGQVPSHSEPVQADMDNNRHPPCGATSHAASSRPTVPSAGSRPMLPPPPIYHGWPFHNPSSACPLVPNELSGLSEEELRTMEGVERSNVEARVNWLRDIHTLLDGAMMLIAQYNQVAASIGVAGIHTAHGTPQRLVTTDAPSFNQEMGDDSVLQSTATGGAGSDVSVTGLGAWCPVSSGANTADGATGYTPPSEIPTCDGSRLEEFSDSVNDVRRRRLERFSQETGAS